MLQKEIYNNLFNKKANIVNEEFVNIKDLNTAFELIMNMCEQSKKYLTAIQKYMIKNKNNEELLNEMDKFTDVIFDELQDTGKKILDMKQKLKIKL